MGLVDAGFDVRHGASNTLFLPAVAGLLVSIATQIATAFTTTFVSSPSMA